MSEHGDTRTSTGIKLDRSWPFVSVGEVEETRRAPATAAALLGAVSVLGLSLTADPIQSAFVAFPAFLSGYALQEWLLWDKPATEVSE